MNYNNPLEILLAVILVLGSIWLIKNLITGTIKMLFLIFILATIIGSYYYLSRDSDAYKKHEHKMKWEKLPKFNQSDLTDYESFKKKFKKYEDSTINDIKFDYEDIKK